MKRTLAFFCFLFWGSSIVQGQTLMSNGALYSPANTNLMLRVSASTGANRLTILGSGTNIGFVGIGDNLTPTERLHVSGNILGSGNITATGNLVTVAGLLHVNSAANNFIVRVNSTDHLTVLNSSGYVGMGYTAGSISERLHIFGNTRTSGNFITDAGIISTGANSLNFQANGQNRLTIDPAGNVGIGTSSPAFNLDVNGTINANSLKVAGNSVVSSQWTTNATDIFYNVGSVSIGTNNPQGYKLAVAGKVIAEEIVVKLQANWPDFVFEPDYQLMSLEAINDYVEKYKHLPGVPPAKEVQESGISLGEMNGILLKKIEELTLHVIEMKRLSEAQQLEIQNLKLKVK